ncbi:MAG: DinB family protein [Vicinamibacterales bacterium]|nr:DinB family protein [Vicinamibacterales bacterium]
MKSSMCVAFGIVVMMASMAVAQQPPAAGGGQTVNLATGLQRSYAGVKANLTEAAEKLSEADYGYRPSPEIRPYGAQFAHTANSQFNACAAAKGEPNPNGTANLEQTKTTRADIVKALADSFAYCDPVFAALTDQSAVELVRQGQNQVARGSVLANLIAHSNEEYGVITVYLRTKNLVPPSTERAQRGRGMGGNQGAAPAGRGQ